jgi:leucyl/phenylalanyl-tRNA--protein transferase
VPKRRYNKMLEAALSGKADFAALPLDRPVRGAQALAQLAQKSEG